MKTTVRNSSSGSSLIVVIVILATLMVAVGVAVEYTTSINRNVQRSNSMMSASTIADSTLEIAFGYWREVCRSQTNVPMPTSAFIAIPTPSPGEFPGISTGSFSVSRGTSLDPNASSDTDTTKLISNYKIVAVDPQFNPLASAAASPPPGNGLSASDATYNYIASADVTTKTLRGTVTTKLRRNFQKVQQSPWSYAIFYVDPLEIHPGPALTVTGWVHTNASLYTAHNSLTFADKVTYGVDWSVNFMPADSRYGIESPTTPNYLSNLPPAMDTAKQPFGLDSSRLFSTTDTNPNNDSYHELIDPAVTGYPDPLAGQRYAQQAQFTINVDASNNVTIYNGTTNITPPANNGNDNRSKADKQNYNALFDALTTGGSLQDGRERTTMRLTTLDVSKIITYLHAPGSNNASAKRLNNWNGVLYFSGSSSSGTKPALELVNGSVLPDNGMTVACQNPVYIKGDYNTGGSPPSNSGDPTTPQVSGYTRQPSAVLGDAVTILSNSWSDANSTAGLYSGSRVASNTTVNTAIVSGNVQTTSSNYSGGAENFPRFLEDWRGKTMTYYGSMVELFQSKTATAPWVYGGNVYEAPVRQWYFDQNFKLSPPPGSLMIYTYVKGRWYTS